MEQARFHHWQSNRISGNIPPWEKIRKYGLTRGEFSDIIS
jgi:hypothetical protein